MATSQILTIWHQLRTNLAARGNLSGTTVTARPLGIDDSPLESIQLYGVANWDQEQAAMSTSGIRRETFTIQGIVFATAPGNSETVSDAIKTTVQNLVLEIETEVRSNPGIPASGTDTCQNATFTGGDGWEAVIVKDTDLGWRVEFEIDVEVHLT